MDDPTKGVLALQIPLLAQSLFVFPAARTNWPPSVVFIEPPADPSRMTVVSVGVAPALSPIPVDPGIEGGLVAVLPLEEPRSVQLFAYYDDADPLRRTILDDAPRVVEALGGRSVLPDESILFLHGEKDDGTPWITAVPFRVTP